MGKRKIATYCNGRYKGNLDEATCNILESLISAEAENSEITDLRNVIYDYDKDGFQVHDPNSTIRSEKSWTYEELMGQIKNLWAFSKQ